MSVENQNNGLPSDRVEQAGKTIEDAAVSLQHDRADEIADEVSEVALVAERQRIDGEIAATAQKKAADHAKVVRDEQVIADALAQARDEPAPGPTPPPQPPRPRVG
ncbi:MAG: hypothetical protein ACRYGP_01250 [Janthinobacterium lividum]